MKSSLLFVLILYYLKVRALASNVNTNNTKINLSNIPPSCSNEDVRNLVGIYGEVKSFEFIRDNPNSKGIAFAEYTLSSSAEDAIKNLDGSQVDNYTLIVKPAYKINAPSTNNQQAAPGPTANIQVPGNKIHSISDIKVLRIAQIHN